MVTAVYIIKIGAIEIIPFLFYPFLLAASAIVFMFIPSLKRKKNKTVVSSETTVEK
jgi:hypothetical protein